MALLQRQIQSQRLQQRADPQLLLANHLLQMSTLELQQYVTQEAAENPALELSDELAVEAGAPGGWLVRPTVENYFRERRESPAWSSLAPPPDDLLDPFDRAAAPETLSDHLLTQLRLHGEPRDLPVGKYLIANIDPDGYLRCSPEEASEACGVPLSEAERVLKLIQAFEPCGVGARTLQECLLIQARALRDAGAPASLEAILTRCWSELGRSKWRVIARELKIREQEVESAVAWLRGNLSPHPGGRFRPAWRSDAHREAAAVRPDLRVRFDDAGALALELADTALPAVHLNRRYEELWRAMRERPGQFSEAEQRHVRDYLARAQMFLKSLQDRKTMLQRVAECILDEQERYCRTEREEEMAPLTRAQVASFLQVHESTVSRAVKEKYLQLPSGRVVPLSHFFDRALCYRKLVANVIAAEDPAAPYSDQEISDLLRRQGIRIARRTVLKYREEMNILSSRQRARPAP